MKTPIRYEYRVIELANPEIELNTLGAKGWELVGIVASLDQLIHVAYLKRRLG